MEVCGYFVEMLFHEIYRKLDLHHVCIAKPKLRWGGKERDGCWGRNGREIQTRLSALVSAPKTIFRGNTADYSV